MKAVSETYNRTLALVESTLRCDHKLGNTLTLLAITQACETVKSFGCPKSMNPSIWEQALHNLSHYVATLARYSSGGLNREIPVSEATQIIKEIKIRPDNVPAPKVYMTTWPEWPEHQKVSSDNGLPLTIAFDRLASFGTKPGERYMLNGLVVLEIVRLATDEEEAQIRSKSAIDYGPSAAFWVVAVGKLRDDDRVLDTPSLRDKILARLEEL